MKKTFLKFLCSALIMIPFCINANAVPTVKKLGTSNVSNVSGLKSGNTATPARAASVRFDATKTATKSAPAVVTKAKNTSTENTTDSRLPSGRYLQVAHSIRTEPSATVKPTPTSEEMVEVKDRILAAENDIETIKQDLDDHAKDADIHVSVSEKEIWNEKQDALVAGEGIKIEENVISSIMKLPVGSETAPRTAPIWVE